MVRLRAAVGVVRGHAVGLVEQAARAQRTGSCVGFVTLLAVVSSADATPQESTDASAGSSAPCAVPLHWRVARVDRAFELSEPEAARIVRDASRLWEEAVGLELFVEDTEEGFPIRFVYDERQARTQERLRAEEGIEARRVSLEGRSTGLAARLDAFNAAAADVRARAEALDRRTSAHNEEVRAWVERGGAPRRVLRELDAAGAELDRERTAVEAERDSLMTVRSELQSEEERLARDSAEHERDARAVARDFPEVPVESGVYREAVIQEAGATSVRREIRIYRFDDDDDLRLVVAHELGHALGLGHVEETGAVMAAEHREGVRRGRIGPQETLLLSELCAW